MPVHLLRNPVKHYEWGSRTALPELLGETTPAARPWAELWIGAHARGSSEVLDAGGWTPLASWLEEDPAARLGPEMVERFGPRLPFLLKLLAVERPLSLQVHPDAARAAAGYALEEARGVALEAPERRYPDPHAKPELLCALTPFEALCGVRSAEDVAERLEHLGARRLAAVLAPALPGGSDGPPGAEGADGVDGRASGRGVIARLLRAEPGDLEPALEELAALASAAAAEDAALAWVGRLLALHPGDPGAAAPLLLHHVRLAAGEALFLRAGELHSYLRGVALELQGSSDNVLRAGLTAKHVDVDELLEVLAEDGCKPEPLRAVATAEGTARFPAPTEAFELSVVHPPEGASLATETRGLELLLCTDGRVEVTAPDADPLALGRGASALVTADTPSLTVSGAGTLHRARAGR